MPPHGRGLFEELGLTGEIHEVNPYHTLGLDTNFMQELLREDNTGATVQMVAKGMHRVLSRVYHPDRGIKRTETNSDEQFRAITEARTSVESAPREMLYKWAKAGRSASSTGISHTQLRKAATRVDAATELVRLNMALGSDPAHFSLFRWSQGVLLQREKSTLLLQNHPITGAMRILSGQRGVGLQSSKPMDSQESLASDFQSFMQRNWSFGIEPGSRIVAYLDQSGRMSLLKPDMSFIMDITDPADEYRAMNEDLRRSRGRWESQAEKTATDLWSRSGSPVLITDFIKGPEEVSTEAANAQIIFFPDKKNRQSVAQDIDLDVAGTVADPDFFKTVRHRNTGAVALGGAGSSLSYVNFAPTTVTEMLDKSAGYSPLLTPGNPLVFFSRQTTQPLVADARMLGMLGNGAQFSPKE